MRRIFFRIGTRVGLSVNFDTSDMPFLLASLNDIEVTRYLMRRTPIYPAEEQEWLDTLHKRTHTDHVFGIALMDTGELIGMMGLHRIDWIARIATTGSWIKAPEHRGKGLGSEAKMLLLDYAFNTLMLRKICSSVLATNQRSRRYNEKCGYRVEGVLKEQIAADGRYVDEFRMAIFKDTYLTSTKT
jgi:RimJ/RimL family protein N-acetyltransferase